ncbi:4F2 cell-surface antigen heavy chain-like [Sinocyclocheilus grahami]|uniref:4F2 cell-surface antigen heavy chain-like n=1 Tax=Sinocyclocheilus grahami TaxID=75366 RepID=UPI0007ACBEF1|nr:PREDICTED: 4F2 cell-surface antigen heavy chain-like [Sinocyclocheilus grahami]
MNKEDDMKEVELNEMDQEKQPMTGETPTGTEKNGCVKVKVPEDTEVKFTGLSKEELMKVAGTAGWVRTRWVLLVLFWLSWIGMLAGAIVIIVQAPRCKPIPEMNWWNEGFLYQISDVNTFSENGLQGVEEKLDYLNQMKVKGLVLGPIHTVQADQLSTLELTSINPEFGSEGQLISLLDRAHRKGESCLNSSELAGDEVGLKAGEKPEAMWDLESQAEDDNATAKEERTAVRDFFKALSDLKGKERSLLHGEYVSLYSSSTSLAFLRLWDQSERFLVALNWGNDSVIMTLTNSDLPAEARVCASTDTENLAVDTIIHKLRNFSHLKMSLGWCLSGRTLGSPAVPVRLYQMLLFTLPGTPVFSAGDEIGLMAGEKPQIMWDLEYPVVETNATAKTLQEEHIAARNFFKTLTHLRGKERSLLHGEYVSLFSSPTSLAFVRLWDQSERFLTAVNWGNDPVTMNLIYRDLLSQAQVRLTTDAANLAVDSMVSLEKFQLGPK